MVCNRCKTVLQQEFENAKISVETIELGEIIFSNIDSVGFEKAKEYIQMGNLSFSEIAYALTL